MRNSEMKFHYRAPKKPRAGKAKPLREAVATMLADQLQLPERSLLRSDLITPMEHDEIVPQVQAEMLLKTKDFAASVEQICEAIGAGKKIGISADYDADGNTSLALFIRMLRACGVPREKIIEHIPNRDQDGYGVNEGAVDDFVGHKVDVMITLDNGTRAQKPIQKALDAGMQVIVIDHHGDVGGQGLPAAAKVVNPNILANEAASKASPYLEETKSLAAVGVSYMMAAEVLTRMNNPIDPKSLLGLVALGTVSDVVPMGWLNRVLVREGLQQLRRGDDKNILRFMRGAGIVDPAAIDESSIAFRLGPIINAPGRLGNSVAWAFLSAAPEEGEVFDKLVPAIDQTIAGLNREADTLKTPQQKAVEARFQQSRAENSQKAKNSMAELYNTIPSNAALEQLIEKSVACNEARKDIEFLMRPKIRAEVKKQQSSSVHVVAAEGWHEGVIGIAASRVKEEFGFPAVIGSIKKLEDESWQAKFSARSIRVPGFPVDIGAAFGALGPQQAEDGDALLAKAGGHPMAGGATIFASTREALTEKIGAFHKALEKHLGPSVSAALANRKEQIFGTLNLSAPGINNRDGQGNLGERLSSLLRAAAASGPFGEAMRFPLVAIRGAGIYNPEKGRGESRRGHLSFDIKGDDGDLKIRCRASHAGGTALAESLNQLKLGLQKVIIIGQLRCEEDGALRMEVEHVLPDKGVAAEPAFKDGGIFTLVGLAQEKTGLSASR